MRIKGKGMPVYDRPETNGDLYLQLQVMIPQQLSREEKELFEKLKEMNSEKVDN